MTSLAEIINQVRSKEANKKSRFISYAAELDTELLAQQYREIMALAPKRHQRDKKYLFERNGIPSSVGPSKRVEEHLAIALYNKFRAPDPLPLPGGRRLEILDYQVPLKAAQSDGGVGKVDMLGLIDGERLAVLELKVKGGDTPVAAVLEALVYAAILEANIEDIGQELKNKGYGPPRTDRPEVIVLAPSDYWQELNEYDGSWLGKITPGLSGISQALSLDIQFLELEIGYLEMGFDGVPPRLEEGTCITSLYVQKQRNNLPETIYGQGRSSRPNGAIK